MNRQLKKNPPFYNWILDFEVRHGLELSALPAIADFESENMTAPTFGNGFFVCGRPCNEIPNPNKNPI